MLPFRNGAGRILWIFALCSMLAGSLLAGGGKHKKLKKQNAAASATPEQLIKGMADIPLPIGHEAKGLTLPDFDANGQLRGKFTAGTARRIDQIHMAFQDLHIATFDEQAKPDLDVTTTNSIFDLRTHILTSDTRGTIKRADFQIDGDTMEFNTDARQGTLRGNVKMVITGNPSIAAKAAK